eukprot:9468520-Pyramimonas_sp.AAC.1
MAVINNREEYGSTSLRITFLKRRPSGGDEGAGRVVLAAAVDPAEAASSGPDPESDSCYSDS